MIINCDDFGFCAQRDAGIMELILLRRVASVSVIINGNNIDNVCRFINKLRQDDPDIFNGLSIGLHFNLTEGIMMSGFVKGRLS